MRAARQSIAFIATLWAPTVASAAELDGTLVGSRLEIAGPCAGHVSILEGAPEKVVVHATAAHPEELAVLAFGTAAGAVTVRRRPNASCWKPAGAEGWVPTMTLAITVPASTPISIEDGGAPDYRIDKVDGALSFSVSGATTAHVDAVTSLGGELSGASKVDVGRADGPASIDLSGTNILDIGRLDADRLRIRSSGRNAVDVKAGQIGNLSIDSTGEGVMSIGATVSNGSVSAVGAASVRIARVTGRISKDVVGGGSVSVLQ